MSDTVLISLGSNCGPSVEILRAALDALAALAPTGFVASSLYRTSPVDCAPGTADFLNAAARFEAPARMTPEGLLPLLKRMETDLGGPRPEGRNMPRALDLDIVLFGQRTLATDVLTVPHPRSANRRFVLEPACEIAAGLRWPGTGRSLADMLAQLDTDEQVERQAPP